MVSATIQAGLLGLLGTVFMGFIIGGLWIWRHQTNLDTDDEDRIEQLENDQLSDFESQLAELYLDIEALTESTSPPDGVPRNEHIMELISRNVDRSEVEAVSEELDEIGTSRELYEDHEQSFKECYRCMFHAAGAIFVVTFLLAVSILSQGSAYSSGHVIVYTLLVVLVAERGVQAYSHFNDANDLKEEFTNRWRKYKNPD